MKSKTLRNTLFNIVLTVGIVIGVGIFFKNKSIIASAHGNTSIIIIAWVIGGVVSISSALAFSLLNMRSKNNDSNVAEFVRISYGTKIGKLAKSSFMFLYYPIYLFVIAIFTTQQMFELFGIDSTGSLYTFQLLVTSTLISVAFISFAMFAPRISKWTQISTTVIKLIPFMLLAAVVIGAIFTSSDHAYWNGHPHVDLSKGIYKDHYDATKGSSGIAIIFLVVPAIKFSFDGFISVTGNKRGTSIKSVSWGITIGMIIVTALYIITTIAILHEGVTTVQDAIVSFFGGNIDRLTGKYLIIHRSIIAIIVISGLGSLNGFSIIWHKMGVQFMDDNKIKNRRKTPILLIIAFLFATTPWMILSVVTGDGTEGFDVISDVVLLLGFAVNALILGKVIFMIIKKKMKLSWVFILFSVIAIIGIAATAGWKLVDGLFLDMIFNGLDKGYFGWPKWTYILIFAFVTMQFVFASYISSATIKFLKRKQKNKNKTKA